LTFLSGDDILAKLSQKTDGITYTLKKQLENSAGREKRLHSLLKNSLTSASGTGMISKLLKETAR
jgi:hypothetical protein